jgi:hypothetical protein
MNKVRTKEGYLQAKVQLQSPLGSTAVIHPVIGLALYVRQN